MRLVKTLILLLVAVGLGIASLHAQTNVAQHADKTSLLRMDLPKPVFTGTPWPRPILPNLELDSEIKRPVIMVPEGTINLASNKLFTSSYIDPIIGDFKLITDGDKETDLMSWVELGPGKQWIQLDLGATNTLYAIVIWRLHLGPRVYHDVIIQVSNDPKCETQVITLFNNDHDNSSGMGVGKDKAYIETFEGKVIDAKGLSGRYVRIYSSGNSRDFLNHYVEVEVHGIPIETGKTKSILLKTEAAKHPRED
jgi:hypothetical protein